MDKLWKYLNGKKTVIAALYWQITELVLPVWFPGELPEPWDKVILTVGTLLTAFGLGHKVVKKVK